MQNKVKIGGVFKVWCYDSEGKLKWFDTAKNLVVNEGLNHLLDVLLTGGTQVTTWYVGLTDGTPTVAAADTMSSHSGWTEITAYSESTRPEYVETRSGQTVSNSASKASFSINASTTSGGAFLTSDSTKGGTSGTLLCAAAFTAGNKSLSNGDTLNVQYDFSAADDGA